MTDKEKEKLHQILSSLWKNDDSVGKMCYNQALQDAQIAIDSLQEEPVSEDTMTIRKEWFEHCKESWYNEGYIDGKYNRDRQFKEPVSEELEQAAVEAFKQIVDDERNSFLEIFKAGVNWQKEKDQSTIELAEDHAYFAGRTKTIDEIKEALLSEVLPCFMHGGEADEVVAKLDEVLNQKK